MGSVWKNVGKYKKRKSAWLQQDWGNTEPVALAVIKEEES